MVRQSVWLLLFGATWAGVLFLETPTFGESSARSERSARIEQWTPVRTLEPGRLLRSPKVTSAQTNLGQATINRPVPVVSSVAVADGGRRWITCGDDHLIRIWDAENGVLVNRLSGHADWVRAMVMTHDGTRLATAGDDGRVRLWDVATGRLLFTVLTQKEGTITSLAFRLDDRVLVAAGFNKAKALWWIDLDQKKVVRTLSAPSVDMRTVRFSPDQSTLAAAGRTGIVRVWKTDDLDHPVDLTGVRRRVRALAFSADSSMLAAAGDAGEIVIWNSKTRKPIAQLPKRPGRVLALTFCGKNHSYLAAGGSDNLIRLWDIQTKREVAQLVGHRGSITSLSWNPEDRTLVSGSFDTTVRQWTFEGNLNDPVSEKTKTDSPQTAVRVIKGQVETK